MRTQQQLARISAVILAMAALMITTSPAIAQSTSTGGDQTPVEAPVGPAAASAMPSSDPSRCKAERRKAARAAKRLGKSTRMLRRAERSGSSRSATLAERHVRQSKRRFRDQQARSNRACGIRLRTKLAPGAIKAPATEIASIRGNPAKQQTVVLKAGAKAPTAGGYLVVDATSSNAGILGRVVASKRLKSDATQIHMRPATLDEAYSTFEFAYSGSLADFGDPVSSDATATASALRVRFTCSGTSSTARSFNVDLSAIQVETLLLADPQFPYFYLSVIGRPHFTLQFDANGSAACSAFLDKKCRAFGPVLMCFKPILKLSADGRISLRYDWQPRFTYELRRAGYTPSRNRDERTFESHGTPSLEGEANAQARFHLGLNASVGGVVGLVGALAPHVDGTASFRTPPPTACAKVTAAINYGLTGYADVFVKRWDWDIAKGEFLHRTLFDRCTGSGGGGGGGGGGGAPVVEITPMGPTQGPSGFGLGIEMPECDLVLFVDNGHSRYGIQMSGPQTSALIWIPDTSHPDRFPGIGTHQISFACQNPIGSEVRWTAPGFSVKVSGPAHPLVLQSTNVASGGEVVFMSGASSGPDPCPALSGVEPSVMTLALYTSTSGSLSGFPVAHRGVDVPTGSAAEPLAVPVGTPPGQYVATQRCHYFSTSTSARASFDYAPQVVTIP